MNSNRLARTILKILGTAVAVWVADWLLIGIHVDSIGWAIAVSIVLGLLNTFIRPILNFLSFPFILISFGLFLIVINAVLLMVTGSLIPDQHFYVEGFWPAFWGSIIISFVSGILEPKDKDKSDSSVTVR